MRRTSAVAACAVALLVFGSWWPAPSSDEAATIVVARRSWAHVWAVRSHDAALLPYYLLAKTWSVLTTTTSPAVLRVPSIAAMTGAVVLLVVLVRDIAGLRVALVAGGVLLAFPATTRFGQDARPYALATLFTTAAVLSWWRLLLGGRRRHGVAFAAAAVAAVLMHAYSLTMLPMLVLAAALLPGEGRRIRIVRTLVPAVVATTLLAPFLGYVERHAAGQPGVPAVSPFAIGRVAAYLPVAILHAPLAPVLSVLAVAAAVVGMVTAMRPHASERRRALAVVGACWFAVTPAMLVLLQVASGKPGLVARYWLIASPGLAILIALAVVAAFSSRHALLIWSAIVLAIVSSLPVQVMLRGADGHGGERWRLLPTVLRQPSIAALPVLISPSVLRALEAADAGLVRTRVPVRFDAAAAGVLSAPMLRTDTAAFRALLADRAGFVAYRPVFTGVTRMPTRSSFNSLVPATTPGVHLLVRCTYYGDSLGIFATTRASGRAGWPHQIAREIEAAARGHATCRY